MRKIFLALFLIAALSLPAFAATDFVIVSGTTAPLYNLVSGDPSVTSDDFIKLTNAPYEFTTIKAALEFANDTKGYINSTYGLSDLELAEDEENDSFSDVSIKLRASNADSIMGGAIAMRDYSAVSTLEISPEGDSATRILNTPTSATRHFVFDGGQEVLLSRLTFEGNNSSGGVEVSSGTVTFDTVNFQNMNISGNGGAVSVSGGSANFLTNTFTNNKAANGGAVAITGGSVNFSDETKFEKNIANSNGGAIFLNASGVRLNLDTITFQENQTQDGFGGAIAVGTAGGSLVVTDSTFSKNVASTSGGAIYVANGSSFTFTGASTQNNFSENEATSGNGGAIYIAGGNSFTFTGDNNFNNNTAGNSGGAVAYDTSASSPIEFEGVTFTNNKAANGGAVAILRGNANFSGETTFSQHTNSTNGGAIYVTASGTVNIAEEVTFSDNVAENGSIVYATNGTVNIYTDLVNSTSTGNGGAVCVSKDSTGNLTVNVYGNIRSNNARANGGAIYIGDGIVNVYNSSGEAVIDNNTADYGGAIYLAASNGARLNVRGENLVTFLTNTATSGGGAIYAGAGSRITFETELLFEDNKANNGNGGAIWLGASNQLAFMTGVVTFRENAAERTDTDDNTLGNGGAIYVGGSGTSTVTLTAAHAYTFTNNEARAYGGAIYTLSSDITFDNFNVSTRNVADIGGGFAGSATGRITLQNRTSVSNQSAPDGGAIFASRVTVNDSSMSSNTATAGDKGSGSGGAIYATNEIVISNSDFTDNTSQGTGQNGRSSGGGAIYVVGNMSITDSYFENNTSQADGAAVFANNDPGSTTTATIGNSYFNFNRVLGSGNGGAVNLTNNQTTTISSNTFTNNEGRRDGGAVYAQGKELNLSNCYFYGNVSERFGGAVYFAQNSTSATDPVSFNMNSTMFYSNHSFGSGGAAYVVSDRVTIRKCTFYENYLVASNNNDNSGGGLFVNTSANLSSYSDMIENCTFVENYIDGGAADNSGGGALAISSANTATIRSCTFTGNGSDYKGSAIFVHEGTVLLAGTIAVGNTTVGPYDIWVDSTILSGGYNRIGIYGQGGGVTDFSSVTGNTTDRTSYPSRTYMTLRSTYFSDNTMAVNERSDLGNNVPPYIGSTRAPDGQYRLLTLMLNEAATLPIADRATNAIPYTRRQSFPADDERGVNRRNPNIGIDIGAVFFDGTRPSDSPEENASYSVAYIQISGVPNAIRRVGQTASLIAKIYYTNGRTAYGGNGAGNEPVTWSATPANYLKVNSSTGVITAMRITPQETYVTLKCETNRTDVDGNPASATVRIKIDPALEFGELNNSPESGNSNTVQIIRDLRYEFDEYNMGYGLIDKNIEIVQSYNYQSIIESIWGIENALAIATSASNYSVVASETNALTYVVSVAGASKGAVTPPVTYLCSFTREEIRSIFGNTPYTASILAAEDTPIDVETAEKIFSVLKVEFKGENGSVIPVLGPNSTVNIADAMNKGALELTTDGQGLNVKLNLMVANVDSNSANKLEITESSESNLGGAILVPDGASDDKISGAIVFPQKEITGAQAEPIENNQQTSGSPNSNVPEKTLTTSEAKPATSGGGSGCNAAGIGVMAMTLLMLLRRKRS